MSRIPALAALAAALLAWVGPAGAAEALSGAAKADLAAIATLTGSAPEVAATRGGYPTMLIGRLSLPAKGGAETVARTFVAAHPGLFPVTTGEIEAARSVGHGLGRTVRFSQTYRGLPVVGAELAVTVDRDGAVRIASSSLEDLGEIDTVPEVDLPEAAAAARARATLPLPAERGQTWSRLVVLAFPGQGRLAWEMHFGALPMLLSNVWAYVDARTGEPIRFENRIAVAYDGLAFPSNPGPYGGPYTDPVEVVLDIPAGGFVFTEPDYAAEMIPQTACDYDEGAGDCVCPGDACVRLSHPMHATRNCPDYHQTVPIDLSAYGFGEMEMHLCSEVQTAHQDENDDFFFEWEGDNDGLNDLDMGDKFAEVQMFHHVAGVYDYFMDLMDDHPDATTYDWEGLAIQPLMATVNFSLPVKMTGGMPSTEDMLNAINPNGELYPFDNAFFMPGGPAMIPGYERPYDSIVFGQGTLVDFGWDGDVIRHEFTHAVANSVSVGVGQYQDFGDEWGVNVEQGGMSEGYADAFPAFMSDEPTMGEYSLAAFGPANVRDLSGGDVCPDFLIGEVHWDGKAWAQSLYQARDAAVGDVAADKRRFEQAVFVGLASVVQKQGFAEAAAATLAAVEALLGVAVREDAAEAFAAHGTDDCPRVMGDGGSGSVIKNNLAAPAAVNGAAGDPFTPGIIQYMVTVDGQQAVNLEFGLPGEAEMQVLVRVGAPILFGYSGAAVEIDDDVLGPFPMDGDNRFSLVSTGAALPAGEYYLMPVNAGTAAGTMSAIEASAGAAIADADGTQHYGDADEDAGADGGPQIEGESSSGCGCDAAGAPARRPSLLGLLLGPLAR
jgi:hypothetical protein